MEEYFQSVIKAVRFVRFSLEKGAIDKAAFIGRQFQIHLNIADGYSINRYSKNQNPRSNYL